MGIRVCTCLCRRAFLPLILRLLPFPLSFFPPSLPSVRPGRKSWGGHERGVPRRHPPPSLPPSLPPSRPPAQEGGGEGEGEEEEEGEGGEEGGKEGERWWTPCWTSVTREEGKGVKEEWEGGTEGGREDGNLSGWECRGHCRYPVMHLGEGGGGCGGE